MGCYDNDLPDRLAPPRRNHYFHGKLLATAHFLQEQDYFNQQRYLLNRFGLGFGVLCGLVARPGDGQVCLGPGVALDAYGREITVPERICFNPWQLTDDCGRPGERLPQQGAHDLTLCLAYAECPADFMPVLVTDCPPHEACAPGSIVESYALIVRRGQPAEIDGLDSALCGELFGTRRSRAERRQRLSAALGADCPELPPGETCVPLAYLRLEDDRIAIVEPIAVRPRLYSNANLLELILCLADRLDDCCGDRQPVPITLMPERLPSGIVNQPYPQQFITASGGSGGYSFSRSVGTLPPGLALATNGLLSGTPTSPGQYPFTVQATDSNGATGQREYEIIINRSSALITLQPPSLPSGRVNRPYPQQDITASGGSGSYTYAIVAGALPDGLTAQTGSARLRISGTPSRAAAFPFTVEATDTNGLSARQDYQIDIDRAPTPTRDAPKVERLEFFDINNNFLASLRVRGPQLDGQFFNDQGQLTGLKRSQNVGKIKVRFTIVPVNPATVEGQPSDQPAPGWRLDYLAGQAKTVNCTLARDPAVPNQYIFEIDPVFASVQQGNITYGILKEGTYGLTFFGEEDPAGQRLTVLGPGSVRLDGEPSSLPSGDGVEGGDFFVKFTIS